MDDEAASFQEKKLSREEAVGANERLNLSLAHGFFAQAQMFLQQSLLHYVERNVVKEEPCDYGSVLCAEEEDAYTLALVR